MKLSRGYPGATLLVLALCAVCSADVLVLDDGTRLEGKAKKDGDQWVVTDAAGKQTRVDQDRITSFELDGGRSAAAPQKRLDVLHQTVDAMNDISQIMARYDTFIQTTPAGPALDQAKTERADWAAKQHAGYVKVLGKWMAPADQQEAFGAEAEQGQQIVILIREGKTADAKAAIAAALKDDPQNPTALYLASAMAEQAGQYGPARDQLLQLVKEMPNHAPSLNNLAVALWHLQFYGGALDEYTAAMKAAPVNRTLLSNIAEALHALPADNLNTPPAQKAQAMFDQQIKLLDAKQAALGLSRWGSQWVQTKDITTLEVQEQTIQGEMADINADFQATQQTLANDNAQVQITQQKLNSEALQNPLPWDYPQLQNDLLLYQRGSEVAAAHLKDLQTKADAVSRKVHTPRYTGTQTVYGPEGAPIRAAAAAATQPAK